MTDNDKTSFVECKALWGTADLVLGQPSFREYRNALYLPFNSGIFFDQDPTWGLYDSNGSIIEFASYTRVSSSNLIGQSRSINPFIYKWIDAPELNYVYAGPIIPHYGHFLLSSTARLWSLDSSSCALFHSDPPLFDHQGSYTRALVNLLKLIGSNTISLTVPTRIRSIIVPQPSFTEQKETFKSHRSSCYQLGQAIGSHSVENPSTRPVYLSKSQLTSGVQSIINESEIEMLLSNRGVEIVHPERLSLTAQISLFSGQDCIVGTASSAFHSQLLADGEGGKRLVITSENFVNSNFLLVDSICRTESTYVSASAMIEETTCSPNFLKQYKVTSTSSFADSICRWIDNSLHSSTGSIRRSHSKTNNQNAGGKKNILHEFYNHRQPRSSLEVGKVNRSIIPSSLQSRHIVGKEEILEGFELFGNVNTISFLGHSFGHNFSKRSIDKMKSMAIDITYIEFNGLSHTISFLSCVERFMTPNSCLVLTKSGSGANELNHEILSSTLYDKFPGLKIYDVGICDVYKLIVGINASLHDI